MLEFRKQDKTAPAIAKLASEALLRRRLLRGCEPGDSNCNRELLLPQSLP